MIRARVRSVSLACLFSTFATFYLIAHSSSYGGKVDHLDYATAIQLLGYYPLTPLTKSLLNPLLLTLLLFLGPLYETCVTQRSLAQWLLNLPSSMYASISDWTGFRTFVAGPVTEEMLFRSVLIPLHLLSRHTPWQITFLTPLYFGIAHVHHFYEFTLTHPHTPVRSALAVSLFQFGYTTLFGWYATFLYLRTGNLVTVILVHSFCNWCGLPRIWGRLEIDGPPLAPAPVGLDPGAMARRDDDRASARFYGGARGQDFHILWTITYYFLLVAGALGFSGALWTLTQSDTALADFSKS